MALTKTLSEKPAEWTDEISLSLSLAPKGAHRLHRQQDLACLGQTRAHGQRPHHGMPRMTC